MSLLPNSVFTYYANYCEGLEASVSPLDPLLVLVLVLTCWVLVLVLVLVSGALVLITTLSMTHVDSALNFDLCVER